MPKTKRKKKENTKKKLALHSKLKFIPALSIALLASFLLISPNLSTIDSGSNVLSYATNTSISGLLSATNVQRSNNGKSGLALNGTLNSAAQAKAKDMVSRNYWSHETPDGQQPWIFFTSAGYQYLAAGENLAYGYADSSSTVTGWMNSPPHKENLLSGNYTEVGFGIANSSNYVGKGEQTVVVAMYGKPQVASASSSAPSVAQTKPKAQEASTKPAPAPEPEPELVIQQEEKEEPITTALNEDSDIKLTTAAQNETPRIQLLTNGSALWSRSALILAVCSIGFLWALHRGFHIKKYVLAGEHYLAKHLHLDLFVLAVVFLGFVLLASSGAVR